MMEENESLKAFDGDIGRAEDRFCEAVALFIRHATASQLNLATFTMATHLLAGQGMTGFYQKTKRYLENERKLTQRRNELVAREKRSRTDLKRRRG